MLQKIKGNYERFALGNKASNKRVVQYFFSPERKKYFQSIISYLVMISFKNEGKINTFSDTKQDVIIYNQQTCTTRNVNESDTSRKYGSTPRNEDQKE